MNPELQTLVARWRKDAAQYQAQVDEARKAGTPHEAMLAMKTALNSCAKELENCERLSVDRVKTE